MEYETVLGTVGVGSDCRSVDGLGAGAADGMAGSLVLFHGLLSCMILALPVTLLWLVLMAVGGVFAKQRAGEVAEEVR